MNRTLVLALSLLSLTCFAADPEGFVYWPKGTPAASAKNPKFENHGLSVSHRDKDGVPELHEKQTDIMVVQSGEATLLVGGEITDRKQSGVGEYRGTAIKGGLSKTLSAGDVIHIPANMPHQFFVPAGKQITYFVVKVDKP